jgi:exodeoxyribonuclease VII large subunit
MMQMTLFANPLTIGELTAHIKMLLEVDDALADVWVEGEISNFSRPSSGHCYFSLKDAAARIQCVMWRSSAARLAALPDNGQRILAHGHVSVYETQGAYQLYVDEILPAGLGDYYVQLERLKARLQAEGLFAEERKRPLPPFPRHIGVVTSPTGAALRDILHVIQRRFPCVEVTLAPTQVQGSDAPEQIAAAIAALNRHAGCDVLIVARGGGSLEELAPFNDEHVARAIFQSRIPVVTGVGHETDISIADLVADRRAPTPTAAAELITPDREELSGAILDMRQGIARAAGRGLEEMSGQLAYLRRAWRQASPRSRLDRNRQRVDEFQRIATLHLDGLGKRIANLDPQATLQRGYAIVSLHPSGGIVRSKTQVKAGDAIAVRVSDGQFAGRVEDTGSKEEHEP